ncbi:SAM-dependent methyltransferase [Paenibacillus aestuarii]|uniref:SAM-dependent methyltransferase n=1 Tax=Paenibacillus aestuarii TaxID=516965 RepID=A0ABW0KCN4_9BACL|nr:SAM-dependent methyltransferase [Paenibacillus aestuarii]
MFKKFKQRAIEPEFMDDFNTGGKELREALRHLSRLNWIFGASGPTLYGVKQLWREAGKPKRLSILDVGAGSGDVNQRLLKWADRHQIEITIFLTDITDEACEEARQLFCEDRRVQVFRSDLFDLSEGCADVITGTQFVHHFSANELPKVVDHMLKASRIGVVINDIHRHWIPWAAVWLTTRIISKNRYIRNDGPLSVAKGFRSEDWEYLRRFIGNSGMFYTWRPLFRYAVVMWKSKDEFNHRS